MKLYVSIFCVVFFVVSCNTTEKESTDNVLSAKHELEQSSCNILTLNVQSKYMISEADIYFIWKKYDVLIDRKIDMTKYDSCYYEAMKQIIINNKGEDIVNSIISESEELSKKSAIEGIKYFDGVYSHLLNSRPIDGTGAKIIDEERYYKILDSLKNSIRENMSEGFLKFWITVDTTGSVEQIELVNQECEDNIYKEIVESLEKLKWHPAIFNNIPVKYRFLETIFIRKKNVPAPLIQKSFP